MVAQYSLRDAKIAQLVQTWLSVVAPHVDYQHCCEASKVGFKCGNELVSFLCPKFREVCCYPIAHTMKLQAKHRFVVF